jgi:hypothetical protein
MLLLPIVRENCVDLLIVLEADNLERMKRYDQAEIEWSKMPQSKLPLRNVAIGYATASDVVQIQRLAQQGKPMEAVKIVTRGWEFRPDLGDHDAGPISLMKKPS